MMTCVGKQIRKSEDEQMHNLHSTVNIQSLGDGKWRRCVSCMFKLVIQCFQG